ncbi:MAG: NADH-quinone oxidoreductase subunit M [Planctomycetota bacterium]|nr:NADH-quinone oxidoreductase subunit M [Planctomycetota bacterium]
MGLLTVILISPLIGVLTIALIPGARRGWIRTAAAVASGIPLLLTLALVTLFDSTSDTFQFEEKVAWVPELGISYHLGVDGISAVLALLASVVLFTGVLSSWRVEERSKEFFIWLLLLGTGIFGTFLSLDLFFFYFFYEVAVLPMYLLIGIWGGTDRKYAATKLTIYISAGAILALVGVILIYLHVDFSGPRSFDIVEIVQRGTISREAQIAIFPFLLFGFGVLAALWPLHTWSPIGYAAAPTGASMMHAGVLKKLGAFAILRIALLILPEGAKAWANVIAALCVFNIIYCGFAAMRQRDMKYVIGYSSCSHMGYVLLGIASLQLVGITGAVYMIWAHGIMAALAFSLIGHIYAETHTKDLDQLGGLARRLPYVAAAFVFMGMANAGIPGTPNFVAELLVVLGSWEAELYLPAVLAVFGIVVTATYMLRMIRDGLFGAEKTPEVGMKDATSLIDRAPSLILIIVLLITGCFPSLLLPVIESGARMIVQRF